MSAASPSDGVSRASNKGSNAVLSDRSRLRMLFASVLALLLVPLMPLVQRLVFLLLSLGPVPQHIGIIMDGNRRYARTLPTGPLPVSQGHLSGFNALRSVLEACLKLDGLSTLSVYAFAINNFSRDKSEVNALMELAKRNLVQLAGHGEVLARYSARLKMVGRKEMLPPDVRAALEKVERMTEGNRGATLNVCIAYASTDEMAYAVQKSIEDLHSRRQSSVQRQPLSGTKEHDDVAPVPTDVQLADVDAKAISVADLDGNMMMAHSPPVDILIRTSGVHRLSDFLLWQSGNAQLQFIERYWPLFGLRELVPIILDYQRMVLRQRLEHWVMQR